jgi:hypothetical protein
MNRECGMCSRQLTGCYEYGSATAEFLVAEQLSVSQEELNSVDTHKCMCYH